MKTTATLVNYYHLCHRKLWLHAKGIRMEHTSDTVYEGKVIGETTYQRRSEQFTEVEVGGSKIDFYDAKNKVVHETKKSDKAKQAHIAQVKYYLWLLERSGVEGATGLIDYPKQRKTEEVLLSETDRATIPEWERHIREIVGSERCPPTINKPICKQCSYHDFCYIKEDDDA